MSMTTSPGPGTGSGTSSQRRTSGSPGSVMTTACIPSPSPLCGSQACQLCHLQAISQTGSRVIATQRHHASALGVEIARYLPYARRDAPTRPACALTHEDQEGRPVTMNNDTPQIFGEDAYDCAPDTGSFQEHDGEAFPAFHGWAGRDDRVEPVA